MSRIQQSLSARILVRKYIFTGFTKSYYQTYKFDSTTELDFSYLLENDADVLKWIRPVPNQFKIYWSNGAHQYEPDFIVETAAAIYMVETKAEKDMDNDEVQAKKAAAEVYCKTVSGYTKQNEGKPWKYVLLSEDDFDRTHQLRYVLTKCGVG